MRYDTGFIGRRTLSGCRPHSMTTGRAIGYRHHTAFPTIASTFAPGATDPGGFEVDMGLTNIPYAFDALELESSGAKTDVRIGWLRSVSNTFHAHSINCFVDELAELEGKDPVAWRLERLGENRVITERFQRPAPWPGHRPAKERDQENG